VLPHASPLSVPGLTHVYGATTMLTVLQYAQVKGDKVGRRGSVRFACFLRAATS
jgi:hypothetical protein